MLRPVDWRDILLEAAVFIGGLVAAGIVMMLRKKWPRAMFLIPSMIVLLGPLANPAGVTRQVVGVASPDLLDLVAASLVELGHDRALVVHGEPGMDELSPVGATRVLRVVEGNVSESLVHPSDFGWPEFEAADLAGGEPTENAGRVRRVVGGSEGGAARAAVLLNAAAALWVAGVSEDLPAGVAAARESIDSGSASAAVERLARWRARRREE